MMGLVSKPGLFRLILALAVVVSHVTGYEIGRLAVLMFFFLSGFWVTELWRKRFAPGRPLAFYGSRAFRIYPLYIICAVVAAVMTGQTMGLANWSLLGVASTGHDPLSVSWSLDVEMQFYLLVPLLVWMLAKPWKASQALLLAAVTLGGWVAFWSLGAVTVAQYLPVFALGVLTSLYDWRPSARAAHLSLAAFGLFTVAAWVLPMTRTFLLKDVADPFDRDIFAALWMLPLVPYIARSLRIRSDSLDRHIGNWSYPIYLVHAPIIAYMRETMGSGLPVKVLAVTVALAVSAAVYLLIDRRVEAWRARVFEPKATPQTA